MTDNQPPDQPISPEVSEIQHAAILFTIGGISIQEFAEIINQHRAKFGLEAVSPEFLSKNIKV